MTTGRFNAMTKERKKRTILNTKKKKRRTSTISPPHVAVLSTAPNVTLHVFPRSQRPADSTTERRDLQNSKRQQLQLATSSQGKPNCPRGHKARHQNGAGCLATQNGADQASITVTVSLVVLAICLALFFHSDTHTHTHTMHGRAQTRRYTLAALFFALCLVLLT